MKGKGPTMAEPANLDKLSRQRIDYEELPGGGVRAILTVTLPNGKAYRYTADVSPEEFQQFANVVTTAETKMVQRVEGLSDEEIAGLFSSIAKGFKSVINGVKKVATSKVFKFAAKGLQTIAPALGPYAPAAMAVGGGMQVASKIASSAVAAEAGAKNAARALGLGAKRLASRKTRGKPRLSAGLAAWANLKRKKAFARLNTAKAKAAATRRRRGRKPKRRKTSTRPKTSARISVLAAAQSGRLRSNKPGDVSKKTLTAAAKKGRVFWITA